MRTRDAMRSPKHQITAFVARSLPHWWLSTATLAGAGRASRLMAKVLGAHRARLATRLGDDMQLVGGRVGEGLHAARGPADERAVHARGRPKPEVQPAVVLAREPGASVHDLELPRPARGHEHLRSDGAAV